MASRKHEKERLREERQRQEAAVAAREQRARRLKRGVGGVLAAAIVGLGAIFAVSAGGDGADRGQAQAAGGGSSKYPYAVGNPGPGRPAPKLRLPSTEGGTFDLAEQRGKTTLLYFQEGLMCQPCWDQITDLEREPSKLKALGIDQMVSISGDELGNLRTKAADEELETPALSDPGLEQSISWEANKYGMMGGSHNGHSFIVVGPDGRIQHRADYGGPPNYTMYVPVDDLVADLRAGLKKGGAS